MNVVTIHLGTTNLLPIIQCVAINDISFSSSVKAEN